MSAGSLGVLVMCWITKRSPLIVFRIYPRLIPVNRSTLPVFAALAPSAPIACLRSAALLIRMHCSRCPHVECSHWLRGLRKSRSFL
ncbi:hypothetical protein QQF64_017834 [Cirrhinus molitorella]|uniref:Secreted protein n=1 Tax=Cirrhinus molitorella TaxID=172907 RepID=A0ABR3LM26_9TELE